MSIDDLTKLMLVSAVVFAIIIISIGIYNLLNNLSQTIAAFRKIANNVTILSNYMIDDYSLIRNGVHTIVQNVNNSITKKLSPVNNLVKLFSKEELPKSLNGKKIKS